MSLLHRGFLYVAAAAAFAVPTLAPRQQGDAPAAPAQTAGSHISVAPMSAYQPDAIEFYLANDTLGYIRPGVKLKVNSVTVGADRKPVLDLSFTDSMDQPLDRYGKVTPGPITPGFVMGAWDPSVRYYIPYTGTVTNGVVTRPGADTKGTWTDLDIGHYKYQLSLAIPATHDVSKTVTIGMYAKRDMTGILDKNYVADNVFYDFRTDGAAVAPGTVWANMDVNKSCNRCHDALGDTPSFHGGARRNVKLCMMCHTNGFGTNGQANAKIFYHKLHMGEHLPSVVAGGSYVMDGDWSTVAWPGNNNRAPYDCTTCHETSAPEKDVWYTRPNRAACGSCHDDVNFATGANHAGGVQLDDSNCASCHQPQGDMEFDASIIGAHTIPEQSKQLKGLTATIVSVTNAAPGKNPTVVYKVANGDGSAVDATKLATFSPMFAGPTTSYTNPVNREDARAKATFDATTGNTTYTFQAAIPASAKGTFVFSADVYRNVNLKRGDGKADIAVRECAMNDVKYFAVDGSAVTPRRVSVDIAKCNVCHVQLGLHGGQRLTALECVICHNPQGDDSTYRPASAGNPESISFQRLIHRIHSGEELTQDYTIYGYHGSVNNFNEVRFPGDRRNCAKCHVTTAGANGGPVYSLPVLPAGIASVTTQRDYFSPQGPATASCLGCHDTRDAAAHAYINTAPFGEACGTCHASAGDWAVEKVHAR